MIVVDSCHCGHFPFASMWWTSRLASMWSSFPVCYMYDSSTGGRRSLVSPHA